LAALFDSIEVPFDPTEASVTAAAGDFGGIARGRVHGVARPGTVDTLQDIVKLARRECLSLAPRGMGLSQSGQSVAQDGICVDLRGLRSVEAPNDETQSVRCEPGATWRTVLEVVAKAGLSPTVMPLNLDLTVGGTLSAGGMGSASHRHGLCVSNVKSLEVVLGTGDLVRCDSSHERGVFDSVLGGVGRVGIMRSIELSLVRVPPKVRTYYLLYDDLRTLLADQQAIAAEGRADHLEGFCSASIQGLCRGPHGRRQALRRWFYGLHLTVGWNGGRVPSSDMVLAGLGHKEVLLVEDDDLLSFSARYDARFEGMRATGGWEQMHPWLEAFVPLDAAAAVLEQAMQLPAFLGDGHRVIPIARRDHPASVAFPASQAVVAVAVLPTGVPPALRDPSLATLRALHDRIREVGGRRYLSGWLFDVDREGAWSEHYGSAYHRLLALQREYDPDGVFRSCLPPL
jgi:cytokinin dehydrogenase